MNAQQVIVRPIISEKTYEDIDDSNTYAFEVNKRANKIQIRKAIEELYKHNNVRVVKVSTLRKHGKKRRRGMILGETRSWKKALVTLRKGDVIDLF